MAIPSYEDFKKNPEPIKPATPSYDDYVKSQTSATTLGAYGRTLGQAFKGLPAMVAQTYEGGTPYDEQTKVDELIAKQQAEDTAFANQTGADQPAFGGLFGDKATMRDIYNTAPSMRSSMAAIAPTVAGAKIGGALGSVVPGVGTAVGAGVGALAGTGASYLGMAKQSQNQAIRQNIDKANYEREQAGQPPLTPVEAKAMQDKLNATGKPQLYGAAESAGESLGALGEYALMKSPLGRVGEAIGTITSPLKRALITGGIKGGGTLLGENLEEQATNVVQNPIQKEWGIPEQGAGETAKQTTIATAPMALLGLGVGAKQGWQQPYTPPTGPLTRARDATQAPIQPVTPEVTTETTPIGAENAILGRTATAANRPVTATGETVSPAGIQRTGNAEYQGVNQQFGAGNKLANGINSTSEGQLPGRNSPVTRGVETTMPEIKGLGTGQQTFTQEGRRQQGTTEEGGQSQGQPIISPAPAATLTQPEKPHGKAEEITGKNAPEAGQKTLLEEKTAPENKPLGAEFTPTHIDPADDTKLMHLGGNDYLDQDKFNAIQRGEAVDPWTFNPEDVAPYEAPAKPTKPTPGAQQKAPEGTSTPKPSTTGVSEETPAQQTGTAEGLASGLKQPWEMTSEEAARQGIDNGGHRDAVEKAFKSGENIPDKVLKDYLWLAAEKANRPYADSLKNLSDKELKAEEKRTGNELNSWANRTPGIIDNKINPALQTQEGHDYSEKYRSVIKEIDSREANYGKPTQTETKPTQPAPKSEAPTAEAPMFTKNGQPQTFKSEKGANLAIQLKKAKETHTAVQQGDKWIVQAKSTTPPTPIQESAPAAVTSKGALQTKVDEHYKALLETDKSKGLVDAWNVVSATLRDNTDETFKNHIKSAIEYNRVNKTHAKIIQDLIDKEATAQPTAKAEPGKAEQPAPEAKSQAQSEAPEAKAEQVKAELVKVKDTYGSSHLVDKRELDSDRTMLRRFNRDGRKIDGMIHRDNIDLTGEKATEAWKDLPYIAGKNDKPFPNEKIAALKIRSIGQKVEDFNIEPIKGGFIAVRKSLVNKGNVQAEPPQAQTETQGINGFSDAETKEIQEAGKTQKDLTGWARGRFGYDRIKGIDFNSLQTSEAEQHIEGDHIERVTPTVVEKTINKAANKIDVPKTEMREGLIKDIDAAILKAHDVTNESIEKARYEIAENRARTIDLNHKRSPSQKEIKEAINHRLENDDSIGDLKNTYGQVTFDVPGDGIFKVLNTKEHLEDFKKKVLASEGFRETRNTSNATPTFKPNFAQIDGFSQAKGYLADSLRKDATDPVGDIKIAAQIAANNGFTKEQIADLYKGKEAQLKTQFDNAYQEALASLGEETTAMEPVKAEAVKPVKAEAKPINEFVQRGHNYWEANVKPLLYDYFNAYNRLGAEMLERNLIKPKGLSASQWLDKKRTQQSEWDHGRQTQQTGIQSLSQKDLWPTKIEGAGEDLRKFMLAAIKAINKAPYSNVLWMENQEQGKPVFGEPVKPVATDKIARPHFEKDRQALADKISEGIDLDKMPSSGRVNQMYQSFNEGVTLLRAGTGNYKDDAQYNALYQSVLSTKEKILDFQNGQVTKGWEESLNKLESLVKENKDESEKTSPPLFSKNDIPYDTAYNAYTWNSMVPEKRAQQEQDGYVEHMQKVYDDVIKYAKTDAHKAIIEDSFTTYKDGYLKRVLAHLNAKSKTASPMVTGPANFPTRRNEKANNVEHNRLTELLEFDKNGQENLKKIALASRPQSEILKEQQDSVNKMVASSLATIKSIDDGAVGMSRPLFVSNLVGRLKTLSNKGRTDLVNGALDLIEETQKDLKKPLISPKNSIWALRDKTNEAKEEAKREQGTVTLKEYEGAQVVNNHEAERVQILFDEKPSTEVRAALKKAAFKWSPNNSAWQRQNTPNGIYSATHVLDGLYKTKETPQGTALYSKATTPTTGSTVQQVKSWLTGQKRLSALISSGKLQVVQGIRNLPEHLWANGEALSTAIRSGNTLAGVQALYDLKSDTVYLVSDMLNKANQEGILAHELYHRSLATDPKLKASTAIFDADLQRRFELALKGIGSKIELDAAKRVVSANTAVANQREEFAAHIIELYLKNPQSFTGKLLKTIKDFFAAIRIALVRAGLNFGFVSRLNPSDLYAMSKYGAKVQAQAAPQWSGQGALASNKESEQWQYNPDMEMTPIPLIDDPLMPVDGDAKTLAKYLLNKYRNIKETNTQTGYEIGFYRDGIETSVKNRKIVSRRLYAILPQLLRESAYTGYEENTKTETKKHILGYETYYAAVTIDGKVYSVRIVVDRVKNDIRGRGYYYHQVEDIALSDEVGSTRVLSDSKSQVITPSSPNGNVTLGQLAGKVNNGPLFSKSRGLDSSRDIPTNNDIRYSVRSDIEEAATKIRNNADVRTVTEGTSQAWDGLVRATAPQYRSDAALEVARQINEIKGVLEVQKIHFQADMNKAIVEQSENLTLAQKARDLLEKGLTIAADKAFVGKPKEQNYGFMQGIDSEDKSFFVDHPELQPIADVISKMYADKAEQVQALGTGVLKNLRENYFKHLWKPRGATDEQTQRTIISSLSKRPLEGSKGFTKQRIYQDFNAGLAAGLEPISDNPLDIVALSMNEMDKYIAAHTVLNQMKKDGMKVFVRNGQKAQEGFVPIDDRYGTVWGPGIVKGEEHIDKAMYEGLSQVAKDMGIKHERVVNAGRGKLGYSVQGAESIVTQHNTETSVLAHEIGHQIDAHHGLWQRIVKEAEGLGKRGIPTKAANMKARVTIAKELRAIADEVASRGPKKYTRKRPEQVAQMVEIYAHAPELMKMIAPNTFKAFDALVRSTPELQGMAKLAPGIKTVKLAYEKKLGGPVLMGRYYVPEAVGQVINNYLSQSLYYNKYVGNIFKGYMGAANMLNQFQLGVFSAFHAGFTSLEAVISHAALGIKSLTEGNYKDAAHYLKTAPMAWLNNPKMGNNIVQEMLNQGSHPEMAAIIEGLQMAGFRWQMDNRFRTNSTRKMLDKWAAGNKAGAALHSLNAIVEQSARPILEWLVPRQKFGVFGEMYNKWMKENPDATHEELRNSAQQIWNRVDSRLGQVVYDRLFMHNVNKNFMQMLLRAPGWTGGTILEVGGGMKDLTAYVKDLAMGKHPKGLTDRAAYTLSLVLVSALINAALTAMFTGEPPEEWQDLIAFKTGNVDEQGNPERFVLPTYLKDIYGYAEQGIPTTLVHKAHPLLSMLGDITSNRNYYGTKVYNEEDNILQKMGDIAGFTIKTFTPFWIQGVAKEQERGGSIASQLAPLIGVMPSPSSLNKTAAQKLMQEYGADRLPQGERTQEEQDKADLRRKIYVALRKGDRTQAYQLFKTEGRKAGLMPADYVRIMSKSRVEPLINSFKSLTWDQAQRVWDNASDEEKTKLKPWYLKKKLTAMRMENYQAGAVQ